MLYVCISFDYELFMGENILSEEEVLIRPTEKISRMLKEEGVSATFFADICCAEAYRRLGKPAFAEAFDAQLRELTLAGHDVQLHIHPHWLRATEVGKRVEFPRESFRLHNWRTTDGDNNPMRTIIHDGALYLKRVIRPVDPDYRCLAFRAGGYCLQPEKELAAILKEEGFCLDSSVCRGMAHDGDGMFYDYRANPEHNNIYFSREISLKDNITEPIPNGILEVPVAGYSTFPYRLLASKMNRSMAGIDYRGHGMRLEAVKTPAKRGLFSRVKQIINATNMITFDFYNADAMAFMLKRLAKESHGRDNYIAAIAHPKGQSDEHIQNMRLVVEALKKRADIRFVSMRQIADKLML